MDIWTKFIILVFFTVSRRNVARHCSWRWRRQKQEKKVDWHVPSRSSSRTFRIFLFSPQRASEDIGRTCTQQRSSSGGDPLEIQQVPKILFHYKIWHSRDLKHGFEAFYYVITASKHKLFYLWIASNFFIRKIPLCMN